MMRTRLKWLVRTVGQSSVVIFVTLALIEGGLRLFPGLIPLDLLIAFFPVVRSEIAASRNLPSQQSVRWLPRDDSGPPLRLFMPNATINQGFKDTAAINPQHTDALGFCNDTRAAGLPADIVALGDSFTWCLAVRPDQAWPQRLAKFTRMTSYNMGTPYIGLYEYVQLFKWCGLGKRPRFVVMNVYEGNDLRDALYYWAHKEQSGEAMKITSRATSQKDEWACCRWSYAFNLARSAMRSEGSASEPTAVAKRVGEACRSRS
jgi:hypothetical protein